MLTNAQQQAVLARISASRMLAVAADLAALDRIAGGPGLHEAAERLVARLRADGAEQVQFFDYPYGPEHRYFSWSMERVPYTEEAELWLLAPDGTETLLCRRSEHPGCFMGALRSTAPRGELFEVVDVGFGTRCTDYRSHRMPGKLALVSGHQFPAAMLEALAERQAEGLLSGPGGTTSDSSTLVPRRLGDPALFGAHRPFGFNLNARQFNHLGNLLATGASVRARVRIQTTLGSGSLPVVSAQLEGAELPEQRVLLVGDLSSAEPPWGAACLVEILRVVAQQIVEGNLPPLQRTLQVLLVPGLHGLVAWLAAERVSRRSLRAAIYLAISSLAAPLRVEVQGPPPVQPSFVPDLLHDYLGWAAEVRGAAGSDAVLRPLAAAYAPKSPVLPLVAPELAVPAVAVACSGGERRGATMAPSGQLALQRLAVALACAGLDLCNLEDADLPRLLCSSVLRGHERLLVRARQLHDRIHHALNEEGAASRAGRHLLWLAETNLEEQLQRERAVLASCTGHSDGPGQLALGLAVGMSEAVEQLHQQKEALLRALVAKVSGALSPRARLYPRRLSLTPLERRASSIVVHRRHAGPLPILALMRESAPAQRSWLAHHSGVLATQPVGDVMLHAADGRRTLLELYDQVRHDYPEADLKLLWRYLEVLAEAGWLELEEVSRTSTLERTEVEELEELEGR